MKSSKRKWIPKSIVPVLRLTNYLDRSATNQNVFAGVIKGSKRDPFAVIAGHTESKRRSDISSGRYYASRSSRECRKEGSELQLTHDIRAKEGVK